MTMLFEEREMLEEASGRWWLFLVTGIAWFIFALLIFQWDYTTVYAISFLFGVVALMAGINEFFQIPFSTTGWKIARGILGVLFIIAGFWAVMVFFFYYIPTIGSILAILAPALLALVQFDHLTPFLVVLFVIGTIQIVMANVIEPAIMGRSLNLSPLVVIVSLMVWGTIWGVVGMFLCVPIMVVLLIVLAHFETTRPVAVLLSADGDIPQLEP